jgi:hypothetical protein
MQIFMGFRPHHIKLRAEHIEGRIGLVIIEDEQQFLGNRRQFAFETATTIPATDLVTPLSIFKERSLRG